MLGRDLSMLGTPALPWSTLRTVVVQGQNQLGTALYRSVRGYEEAAWGLPEQLLATIVDAVQLGNWQRAAANSKTKPPKPAPLPRPGVGAKPKKTATGIPLSQARRYVATVHEDGNGSTGTAP